MYQSEEVCGNCKHGKYDADEGYIWCLNEDGPEYLEEKRWSETCDCWEANNEN